MKNIKLYRISRGHRKLTVWEGSPMTHSLIGTLTVVPDKGLTRRQRHAVFAETLFKNFGIPGPSYRATKGEIQAALNRGSDKDPLKLKNRKPMEGDGVADVL